MLGNQDKHQGMLQGELMPSKYKGVKKKKKGKPARLAQLLAGRNQNGDGE